MLETALAHHPNVDPQTNYINFEGSCERRQHLGPPLPHLPRTCGSREAHERRTRLGSANNTSRFDLQTPGHGTCSSKADVPQYPRPQARTGGLFTSHSKVRRCMVDSAEKKRGQADEKALHVSAQKSRSQPPAAVSALKLAPSSASNSSSCSLSICVFPSAMSPTTASQSWSTRSRPCTSSRRP